MADPAHILPTDDQGPDRRGWRSGPWPATAWV